MIVAALVFFGTLVILPAGISFAVEREGKQRAPKPTPVAVVPEPEPEPIPKPEVVVEPEPELVPTTVVTIAPKCDDEESIVRLRAATFDFLSQTPDLPPNISFDVIDCTEEGMVDIEIIEIPK
tara:strand:+ start:1749 stop:2117 length:369 start_codon:yes stop_codon:yes gene_type:complete